MHDQCAAKVHLSLPTVLIAAIAGALLGAEVGYLIGFRAGPALLDRPDRPSAAGRDASREALERYGAGRAIVLARFIPLVRTVLNPMAGTIGVPHPVFTRWQVVGGLIWTVGVTMAGYLLGQQFHGSIDKYLLPIIAVIVVLSLIPVALELRRSRGRNG